MKKLYIITLTALVSALLFSSCKKALDQPDVQHLSPAQVYNDSTIAISQMNYIYTQNLPSWFGNGSVSAIASAGTAPLTEESYGTNVYNLGTLTQESVGDIGTANTTSTNYGKIRLINTFIQGINGGSIAAPTKARFVAQALFWRAFRYFELVKLYGGVPLVLTPINAVGTDSLAAAFTPRSSTTQTFNQIITDLNTAIASLPVVWPAQADYGRVTKGAAQAYLGRVLMTWASPQFNSPIASLNTINYTLATTDNSRWQAAYTASTQAIATLSANGWGLYPTWDVTMWTTEGGNANGTSKNPEAVLVTEYNTDQTDIGSDNNGYTNSTVPKYIGTTGGSNQPTLNLVQQFPMADGYAPGTSPTYPSPGTVTAPALLYFDNRDPRFGQTIAYNGTTWPLNGNATYKQWTYYFYNNPKTPTTTVTTEPLAASGTGFYLRKAIDPSILTANYIYSGTDWQEIRYAEVLLNQAEAAANIGHLAQGQEAYANLIAIRKRAGILPGTNGLYGLAANMTLPQMITAIMYERQIEEAFEGKRYWDLRRQKALEVVLNTASPYNVPNPSFPYNNTPLYRLQTTLKTNYPISTDYLLLSRDNLVNTTSLDAVYTTYFTLSIPPPVLTSTSNPINYIPSEYFFGIPTAALQNNPSLIQNSTWGGTFNPLL